MFRFAISNAFRRKGIAFFAILGTALGCALMVVLLSISDGMDLQMSKTMSEVGASIVVSSADAPPGMASQGTPLPKDYVDDIENIEHVEAALPSVSVITMGDLFPESLMEGFISISGIDLNRDAEMEGATTHIIGDATITGNHQVIIGKALWDFAEYRLVQLGEGEMPGIGDTFSVIIPNTSPPEKMELTIVGLFETGNMLDDSAIFTSLATAQELAGLDEGEIHSITVRVDDIDNVDEVATTIEEMYANSDSEVPVSLMMAKDILGEINQAMGIFHGFLWIISLVAAIAGGVSIFIVMLISVIERTKEFGILKASGWSNRNIIGSVVVQSITIALLGAMVGLAIGYGGGQGIDWYLGQEIAIITGRLVAIIAAFGIIVGLIGGLYPALRAARVSPIESMRAI